METVMSIFEVIGQILFFVSSLAIGIFYYSMINSMFNIVHFGFKSVVSFIAGCLFAGYITVTVIVGLFTG